MARGVSSAPLPGARSSQDGQDDHQGQAEEHDQPSAERDIIW
jgi:hypothetical protein